MKVIDYVTKKCFFTTKEGKTGVMFHRSVVLDDGTVVRWNRKSGDWKIEGPERWVPAVATSLYTRAMVVAHDKGRFRRDIEEFNLFRHFQARMIRLVDEEAFVEIVTFLSK